MFIMINYETLYNLNIVLNFHPLFEPPVPFLQQQVCGLKVSDDCNPMPFIHASDVERSCICRREIAASLNDYSNRWCKRENVEPGALKEWKINII